MLSNRLTAKLPQVAAGRYFATAAAKASPKAPFKPSTPPPKTPPPSSSKLDTKPKKTGEPEPFSFSDDVSDPILLNNSTPVQPLTKPIQPFANKKIPPPVSKVLISASSPSSPSKPPTLSFSTPAPAPTPAAPTPAAPAPAPTPIPTPTATPIPIPIPALPTAAKAKKPAAAAKPKAPSTAAAKPATPNASQQGKELARQLQGRSPAQLLNQIAQLQQHNATLQSQLVYHSAVEAIYGDSGFTQLGNLISEFTEEEANILKASGFESENVKHHLELRQRDLCLQFTQTMGADLGKHITAYVKKLKDQHRQSASAATATQQTLRNAGVPDSVISTTLVGLQPHLDELQTRIVRWEKLKADVDLLIATHSNH